jgi:hypothetical protein
VHAAQPKYANSALNSAAGTVYSEAQHSSIGICARAPGKT